MSCEFFLSCFIHNTVGQFLGHFAHPKWGLSLHFCDSWLPIGRLSCLMLPLTRGVSLTVSADILSALLFSVKVVLVRCQSPYIICSRFIGKRLDEAKNTWLHYESWFSYRSHWVSRLRMQNKFDLCWWRKFLKISRMPPMPLFTFFFKIYTCDHRECVCRISSHLDKKYHKFAVNVIL